MGYTHYLKRPKSIEQEAFNAIGNDLKKIVEYCDQELGIAIAGGRGDGKPEITGDLIAFNGSEDQAIGQWTTSDKIKIPWPSDTAGITEAVVDPIATKTAGVWFAGNILQQRVAPVKDGKGSGSYETMFLSRERVVEDWEKAGHEESGLWFEFCKTAYRPYDVAVTAFLIAVKRYVPECIVSSDGEEKDWIDGMQICSRLFGYGFDFSLEH